MQFEEEMERLNRQMEVEEQSRVLQEQARLLQQQEQQQQEERIRAEEEERQRVEAEAAVAAEQREMKRQAAAAAAAAAETKRLEVVQKEELARQEAERQEVEAQERQQVFLAGQLKAMEELQAQMDEQQQRADNLKHHQQQQQQQQQQLGSGKGSNDSLQRGVPAITNNLYVNPYPNDGLDEDFDDVEDLDASFGALREGEMDEFAWLQDIRNVTDNDSVDANMALELEMSAVDIDALLTGRDVDMEGGMDEDEGKQAAQRAAARLQAAAKAADRSLPNASKKNKKHKSTSDEPTFAPLTWTNVQKRGPVKEGLTTNWGVAYFNVGDNGLNHLPSDYVHTDADDVPPTLEPTNVRDEYWQANDRELLKVPFTPVSSHYLLHYLSHYLLHYVTT